MQMTLEMFNPEICQTQTATAEDFLARVSALLESGGGSRIHEELFSLKSCGWRQYKNLNIFSWKTSPDCFPTMEVKLLELSSQLWGNWGIGTSTRCLTAKITESHKTGKGCSLSDIMEDSVDEKYFLSDKATKVLLEKLMDLSATNYKSAHNCVRKVKQVIGGRQGNRVYDPEGGMSVTLNSQGGGKGAKTGLYMVAATIDKTEGMDNSIQLKNISEETANRIVSREYKEIARNSNVIIKAVLTPDREEKRQNGRRIKDNGEPMFTLTAQDRHGVMITEPTVFEEREDEEMRFFKDNLCETLRTISDCENKRVIYPNARIRRLTPREGFRLQGFPDEYFERAASVNSDNQLYKQAGNSVTTTVIRAIAERLANIERYPNAI